MPASGSEVRDRSCRAVADRGLGRKNPAGGQTPGTLRQTQSRLPAGRRIGSVFSWLCGSTHHHRQVRSRHFQALCPPCSNCRFRFWATLGDEKKVGYWTLRHCHWTLVLDKRVSSLQTPDLVRCPVSRQSEP